METKLKIKEAGLKVTPQRQLVYRTVKELCHASIEQIVAKIEQTHPEMTLSTVYRVLTSFCDCNLLTKVNHPKGKVYYDINVHEHSHIITPKDDLIDVVDPELRRFVEQRIRAQIPEGTQIDKITIQITTSVKSE
ncbi:MAG: transcriptional repressor [Rikenellaceae bacterium]